MARTTIKNSTLFYHDWLRAFEKMSDEDVGKITKALLLLDSEGVRTTFEDNPILDIIFSQFSSTVERNREKYDESCQKRSDAAKKREAQKITTSTILHNCDDRIREERIGEDRRGEEKIDSIAMEQPILDKILLEWNSRKVTRKIGQSIRPMTSRYDAIRILLAAYSFEQFISTIRSLDEQEWLVQRLKERNIHVDFDSFLKPENFKNYFEGKYKDVYKEEKRKPASKFSNFEERSYSENQYDALEQAMGG